MSWGSAPWGSSWGTGTGAEPSVTPWDMLFGRQQGRIAPVGATPPEGLYSFCLGLDSLAAEHLQELDVGDYIELTQTGDFDTETFLAIPIQIRGPASIAAGTTGWKVSLIVNGAERASRTFGAGVTIDTTLTANVSDLVGNVPIAIRLELV